MDNKVTKDLSEEELISLRDEVSKYMTEGELVTSDYVLFSLL
jgi:small subunit ribosomal protein S13